METYNDLFVRLKHGVPATDVLDRLNALDQEGLSWELEEDLGGAAGFHALAGSAGWEAADRAAQALSKEGHPDVWTYLTHDEDSEAVFTRYNALGHWSFVASTSYADDDSEEDEQDAEESTVSFSEEQWRQKLGENAYCWTRFDRWTDGMPVFHRRATHEELIEDIVGPRRTKEPHTPD